MAYRHYSLVIFPLLCFFEMLSDIAFISLILSSAETSILYSFEDVDDAVDALEDVLEVTGTGIMDCSAVWMIGPGGEVI